MMAQKKEGYAEFNTEKNNYLAGDDMGPFVTFANAWVDDTMGQTDDYTFQYPADKQSGYYVVPSQYCPEEHCDECIQVGACGVLYGTSQLYTINPDYTEDFTYTAEYPIYGAWEIVNQDDFSGKCFVGDCNKANKRHVFCFNNQGVPTVDSFDCDKWAQPDTAGGTTHYCVNGQEYDLRESYNPGGTCQKPMTINFYYVWNDFPNYEGYDPNWQSRAEAEFNFLNSQMQQFNIQLQANYYEYHENTTEWLPSEYYWSIHQEHPELPEGDVQVTIFAGTQNPTTYGRTCTSYGVVRYNPCGTGASGKYIRIQDYYLVQEPVGVTLRHEFTHSMGATDTGGMGSLAGTLYLGDVMSYGGGLTPEAQFRYESRILLWLMGRN